MSDHILRTIEDLRGKLREQEVAVTDTKKLINSLSKLMNLPEPYADADTAQAANFGAIRGDTFYGQPLATAVRQILEMRKAANLGPTGVGEIYETLIRGGYLFETKDADNAKRGLRVSLSKNPIFHKVPSGEYGLRSWYPNVKDRKDDDDDVVTEKTVKGAADTAAKDNAGTTGKAAAVKPTTDKTASEQEKKSGGE